MPLQWCVPWPCSVGPPFSGRRLLVAVLQPGLCRNNPCISEKRVQRRRKLVKGARVRLPPAQEKWTKNEDSKDMQFSPHFPLPGPLSPGVLKAQVCKEPDTGVLAHNQVWDLYPSVVRVRLASANFVWEEMRSSLHWAISRLPEPLTALGGGMNIL